MSIINHQVRVLMVTFSDDSDVEELKDELETFGKVQGLVFKDDNGKLKGGGYLWKYGGGPDKLSAFFKKDEYYLILLSAITSIINGKISKRGLFNLKNFHKKYPNLPIHDLGVTIDASEIIEGAKKIQLLTGKGMNDKEIEAKQKEQKKIKKLVNNKSGFSTREFNVGVIIIEDDKDLQTIYNQLKDHTGERELQIFKFPIKDSASEVEVGLILWHHDKEGFDDYYAFLILDKDTWKEGKFFDWSGPNIKEFEKLYKGVIPIIKIKWEETGLSMEASRIIKKLEKSLKK